VARLSLWRPWFHPRSFHVGFEVGKKRAVAQVFCRILELLHVSIIPSLIYTYILVIIHRIAIMPSTNSVIILKKRR